MNLRDTRAGAILITVIVTAAVWYAECPDDLHRSLSQMDFETKTENPHSSVYIRRVAWSPDSRKLLSIAFGEIGLDGPLVLHDLDNRPYRMPIEMSGESVSTAALVPDGRHLLVATHEGRLWWIAFDSEERTLLLELPSRLGLFAAALSRNGKQAVAASADGCIYICDIENRVVAVLASGLASFISDLRFSNDGKSIVSAGQDGWLRLWELPSGRLLQSWKAHDEPARAAAFLPDQRIISASLDGTTRIWSASNGHEIWRGDFGILRVNALAISPDEKTAAWGGCERKIVVWDLESMRKKYEIPIPASNVWDLQFSPDNKSLAVAASEGTLRLYDAQVGTEAEGIEVGQKL